MMPDDCHRPYAEDGASRGRTRGSARPWPPVMVALAALLSAGCHRPVPSSAARDLAPEALARLSYPVDAPLGPDLDIVVLHERRAIRLVNRTARSYQDQLLWLNREFVGPVDRLRIGTENRLQLDRFVNRHQEPYPTATLLAPDKARALSAADLFDPATGRRHRLVVQDPGRR